MTKSQSTATSKDLIGLPLAAEILGVHPNTLRGFVAKGEIPYQQQGPGSPLYFERKVIEERARTTPPRPRGRPVVNPPEDSERVQTARATLAEVERWKAAAQRSKKHKGAVGPWLRDLANRAANRAGV